MTDQGHATSRGGGPARQGRETAALDSRRIVLSPPLHEIGSRRPCLLASPTPRDHELAPARRCSRPSSPSERGTISTPDARFVRVAARFRQAHLIFANCAIFAIIDTLRTTVLQSERRLGPPLNQRRLLNGDNNAKRNAAQFSGRHSLPPPSPHLLISEVRFFRTGGIDFLRQVRAHHPRLPILILSTLDEGLYAARVLAIGVDGCIMKQVPAANRLAAIRRIRTGQRDASAAVVRSIINRAAAGRSSSPGNPFDSVSHKRRAIDAVLDFESFPVGTGTRRGTAWICGVSPALLRRRITVKH